MKTPNTHSQDWKVVTYHQGDILDTRFFATIEEASRFWGDLSEILESQLHDGMRMYCEVLPHNPRPAQVLLDWL
jgi:hypothetical protein